MAVTLIHHARDDRFGFLVRVTRRGRRACRYVPIRELATEDPQDLPEYREARQVEQDLIAVLPPRAARGELKRGRRRRSTGFRHIRVQIGGGRENLLVEYRTCSGDWTSATVSCQTYGYVEALRRAKQIFLQRHYPEDGSPAELIPL